MNRYEIKYQAGPYEGTRFVFADDEDEAISKVKLQIRRQMTLSMYYDSYKVVDVKHNLLMPPF